MVAYSFRRRFVDAIRTGLDGFDRYPPVEPKRQTIRADRRRHARPGEQLQLYCGMRTKSCFLIGRATCTEVRDITMDPRNDWFAVDHVMSQPSELDAFARRDGFVDWDDMRKFWREEHPGVDQFAGVLIMWAATPAADGEPSMLSKAMKDALRRAPNDWRRVVVPGPSVVALEKRGLVVLRDAPGEKGPLAGFQWRITIMGRVMDARDTIDNRCRIVMTGNS